MFSEGLQQGGRQTDVLEHALQLGRELAPTVILRTRVQYERRGGCDGGTTTYTPQRDRETDRQTDRQTHTDMHD